MSHEYEIINVRLDGTIQKSMKGVVIPKDLSEQIVRILINSEHMSERIKNPARAFPDGEITENSILVNEKP